MSKGSGYCTANSATWSSVNVIPLDSAHAFTSSGVNCRGSTYASIALPRLSSLNSLPIYASISAGVGW